MQSTINMLAFSFVAINVLGPTQVFEVNAKCQADQEIKVRG